MGGREGATPPELRWAGRPLGGNGPVRAELATGVSAPTASVPQPLRRGARAPVSPGA